MPNKTLSLLFLLLLPVSSFAAKQWVDETILKSVFQNIRASSYKYNFITVTNLSGHVGPDAGDPSQIREPLDATTLASATRLIASGQRRNAAALLDRAIARSPWNAALFRLRAENEHAARNPAAARTALRQALILDRRQPASLRLRTRLHPDLVPAPPCSVRAGVRRAGHNDISVFYEKDLQEKKIHYSWISYALSRAFWRYEGGWQTRFPDARWYQPSFEESLFCYKALLHAWQQTRKREKNLADPDLDRLLALDQRGLLSGYVFFHVYAAPLDSDNQYLLQAHTQGINGYYAIWIGAAQ
jgi:hypothetical protein